MKKTLSIILITILLVTQLIGCSSSEKAPGENGTNGNDSKPIEMKIATVGNDDHQYTVAAKYFVEELEKIYDGNLKIDIYSNAALGGEREAAEGVKLGTIQMTVVTSDGALPAWVPDTQVLSVPYLFETKDEAYRLLDGVISEYIEPKFEEQGFKHLGFAELGFRHFTNNLREISTASDMEGMSIRVQEAPIWFELLQSLDASAVPVAFNELYTALQQGMVDGQENPIGSIYSSKFNEVQKYLTLDGHTYAAGSMIMNLDFYNSLPEDLKAAVVEAAEKSLERQRVRIDEVEQQYLGELEDSGMKITEPDKKTFVEATKGMYNSKTVQSLVNPELIELVLENK